MNHKQFILMMIQTLIGQAELLLIQYQRNHSSQSQQNKNPNDIYHSSRSSKLSLSREIHIPPLSPCKCNTKRKTNITFSTVSNLPTT